MTGYGLEKGRRPPSPDLFFPCLTDWGNGFKHVFETAV